MYIGRGEPIAEDTFSMKNLTTYGKYGQVENGKYVCIIKWCFSLSLREGERKEESKKYNGEHIALVRVDENKQGTLREKDRANEGASERDPRSRYEENENRKIIIYIYILFFVYVRKC